jgi:hypothetical protein
MDANTFWRQLEVVDGDDFYGERCELGRNEHRYGQRGTFTLYQPGMRRITFYSLRLPRRFPLATERWQVVAQMKQANPSDLAESGTGYGYSPVLAMIADEDSDTDGIAAGEAIPAHLRVGLYHDPRIPCEPSCRVRVDNVQVVAPSGAAEAVAHLPAVLQIADQSKRARSG